MDKLQTDKPASQPLAPTNEKSSTPMAAPPVAEKPSQEHTASQSGITQPIAQPPVAPPAQQDVVNQQQDQALLDSQAEQPNLRPTSDDSFDEEPERIAPAKYDPQRDQPHSRKRRKPEKGMGSKIMQVISGMIVGIGTLLVAAALFIHFFGIPGQTVAEQDPGKSKNKTQTQTKTKNKKQTESVNTDVNISTNIAPTAPITVADVKPREALVPSLKLFAGSTEAKAPDFSSLGFTLTAKAEYAQSSGLQALPEPIHYRGKIFLNSKPATGIVVDHSAEQKSFFPQETFATCLRLSEGLFLVPITAIEYADFITVFDGDEKYEVSPSRLIRRGDFRVVRTTRRPDFPRIIASSSGDLDGSTKGVTLIWVDRNSEIHIKENIDATGYDSQSTNVTFEVPSDSTGGVIVNSAGQIAGLVAKVENGTGTVTQISTINDNMGQASGDLFDFNRMPVSDDEAGKIREASACVAQVICKRNQQNTHAAIQSNIETQRGTDQTSRQTFADRYDVNFKRNGEIEDFSLYQGEGCRLPGFLGHAGNTAIIKFPENREQAEWRVESKLSLGPTGNDRILVKNHRNTNKLSQVIQSDRYRIVNQTDSHLIIERDYLVKSLQTEPNKGSLQWDVPAGFPFQVQGKFIYRYDKSLNLATRVKFEGVEQKRLSKDLVVPLNLSFEMIQLPPEEIDENQLPWKSQ